MTPTTVRLYASAPYPCSYLPGHHARSQVLVSRHPVQETLFHQLIHHGFRRSGHTLYRPYCEGCRLCIPIRVPVALYEPSRSQNRAWRLHASLTAEWVRPVDWPEIIELYQRYQCQRHSATESEELREHFPHFLMNSPVNTWMVLFRDNGILKMVSVIDQLPDGLSAVYTFYEPDAPRTAYGNYAIRWQIEHCRNAGLPFLYLGYWVPGSEKMDYKQRFRPFEILYQGEWRFIDNLMTTPFSTLSSGQKNDPDC